MNEIDIMLNKKEAEAATVNPTEAFEIRIYHKLTTASESVPVFGSNTLGQVVQGYGHLIGLKSENNKFWFYNENTTPKRSVSDQSMTIEEFGLKPGDTLGISDEGSVACR